MSRLLIFGYGYCAQRIAARLAAQGWNITGTRRLVSPGSDSARNATLLAFDDEEGVRRAMQCATHILVSVPPDSEPGDAVLRRYGADWPKIWPEIWTGYLSSTGVYGDRQGGWVDETTPPAAGRRSKRAAADLAWQQQGAFVFRLPGIYGPGRSTLERVLTGSAQRILKPGHVFSRIHVDDIASSVIAAMDHKDPQIYNIADDEPANSEAVIAFTCDLLAKPYPPLQSLDQADLSPMARGFYDECRRIDNRKLKRELGVRLAYPNYRAGLRACMPFIGREWR